MKNRRFLSFITALLLIACLTVTAFATEAKLKDAVPINLQKVF